jgi:phosphinothricin acetyltransferase
MVIRKADPTRDGEACAAVYAPYVADSVISFEEVPPTAEQMAERIGGAHAWFVAEVEGVVVGYANATSHHSRAAYRWSADVGVYIDGSHHREGVGRSLYTALFDELRASGIWTVCAGITEPNPASTALHLSFGFVPVGTYRRIGWKAGAWRDVTWLQLDLRPGESGPPPEPRARIGHSPT